MGLKSSNDVLWKAKNLNLTQLREAIQCLKTDTENKIIRVDVDCSWVACSFARGKNHAEIISTVGNFLHVLAMKIPAVVTPILDGEKRHHSKQDSTKRVAKREKRRIDAIIAR
jgi:hypothetical protein